MGGIMMAGARMPATFVCAVVMLWSPGAMAQYYGSPQIDQPYIAVTGDAEIKVAPDKAVITLGVESIDSSMVTAKKETDGILKKVTRAITKLGVDESDIQTDYLNVEPVYARYRELDTFQGNHIRRRLIVTLKDISKFDELLSDVLSAGASRILDVQFVTEDLRKYRDQARAMAVKAAAEKARDMTAELGQTVGKAIYINENKSYRRSWYWYYGWNWGRYSGASPFNVSQNVAEPGDQADAPLAVGKISVTASVTAFFLLE
jgi:uncharacterized protein YggE